MNSYQAKKLSLPEIMARLGYEPVKTQKNGKEYWYASPFRAEKTPSFHTSFLGGQWIWNDFADRGGTVIDFVLRHENYNNVADALHFLENMFHSANFKPHTAKKFNFTSKSTLNEKTLVLDEIKPLKHPALIGYLSKERAIDLTIGKSYLKEVHFHNTENKKKYFALGMENQSGGYEIRNPFFKSSLGSKDLSFIKGQGREEISVFEGYMDFLSFLTDSKKKNLKGDVLILNSISFTEKAMLFIHEQNYSKLYAFLDNDAKGMETLNSFRELPIEVVALNHLYKGFKDYNQYLQNRSKSNGLSL